MHDHPRLKVVDPEIFLAVVAHLLECRQGGGLRLIAGEAAGSLLGIVMLDDSIRRLQRGAGLRRHIVQHHVTHAD
jgi:hypothetical protein